MSGGLIAIMRYSLAVNRMEIFIYIKTNVIDAIINCCVFLKGVNWVVIGKKDRLHHELLHFILYPKGILGPISLLCCHTMSSQRTAHTLIPCERERVRERDIKPQRPIHRQTQRANRG